MKKFIFFFHLALTLFFPYMPIVHAGIGDDTRHLCSGEGRHNKDTSKNHSMNICIEIVDTVLCDGNGFSDIQIPYVSSIPFEQYREAHLIKNPINVTYIFHATDPPCICNTPFLGTVKILS